MDEARVDELFSLPPEEFTAARDRLAQELTDAGDRDGARTVKALRRPTAAAWAVNAASRRQPKLVEELLETAATLRTAQRRAASGLAADEFRRAQAERRRLVRQLTEEAEAALTEAGRSSDAHVAAAARTFETAASEVDAGEAVKAGRLSKELEPTSGFDVIDAFTVVPGAAEPEPPAPKETKEDKATAATRRKLAAAQREVERSTRRAATMREELRAAEREASDAEKAVRAMERDLERARKRAAEERQRADRAATKAERAERSLEEAEAKAAEVGKGSTGAR